MTVGQERLTAAERQVLADREELAKLRSMEQLRGFIQVETEKLICKWAHVDWAGDGSHMRDIGIIREQSEQIRKLHADVETLQNMIRQHKAVKERNTTVGRSLLLQLLAIIFGALCMILLNWINRTTGLHLTGAAP